MFNDPIYFIFAGAALVLLLTIIYFITQKSKAEKSDKFKKEARSSSHSSKNTKARKALEEDTESKKKPEAEHTNEIIEEKIVEKLQNEIKEPITVSQDLFDDPCWHTSALVLARCDGSCSRNKDGFK